MERGIDIFVLGIGNVLWADEGFGVRAVEALHSAYRFPDSVVLEDGVVPVEVQPLSTPGKGRRH